MANFPRLDELAVAANSWGLFNGMLVFFDSENGKDLDFANGLHNLWAKFLERTNERQLFITELECLCPSVMTYKIFKFQNEVQKHDLIQLLELRKMIVGTYRQVSRKIALIETIRHKDWLVQEQTALGKDFSNPLMADNLPKIVWLSTHHITMPSPNHPTPDLEKTFSSNFPDYFPATSENNSLDSSNDFTKYLLDILVFSPLHDDSIVEIMQAYNATDNELPTPPLQTIIALPAIIPSIMPPKRTSTSDASAMTQATIRKLVADSITTALEA
ncbi:hypothetical protein Tco_0458524 [Tanacetum coccineum]